MTTNSAWKLERDDPLMVSRARARRVMESVAKTMGATVRDFTSNSGKGHLIISASGYPTIRINVDRPVLKLDLKGREFGVSPKMRPFHEQIATQFESEFHLDPAESSVLREFLTGEKPAQAHDVAPSASPASTEKVEALGSAVLQLMEVVQSQQEELAELRRAVELSTLQKLRLKISEDIRNHLKESFRDVIESAADAGVPVAEIDLGRIVEKGKIEVHHEGASSEESSHDKTEKRDEESSKSASLKLSGIAAHIAEAGVSVDLAEKLKTALKSSSHEANAESFTESFSGEFEIVYEGTKLTLGGTSSNSD